MWVSIASDANYDQTLAAVTDVVNGYPGIDHKIHTYLQERVEQVQASDRDIVLRIYGTNQDELLATGNNVLGILSNIDGVADARRAFGLTT